MNKNWRVETYHEGGIHLACIVHMDDGMSVSLLAKFKETEESLRFRTVELAETIDQKLKEPLYIDGKEQRKLWET